MSTAARLRWPRIAPGFALLLAAALVPPVARGARHRRPRTTHTTTGSLSRQIDALLATPQAAQARWGISITTLDGRVLYEKNDTGLFAPASNTKLVTTSTALGLLGPDMTIETRVVAPAAPDAQGVIHGDVSLMGAGDASMSGRAYPYNGSTQRPNPPLAAIDDLAQQLQQRGVRHITGGIVGDDTAFVWEPYGSGWAWDDLEWSWGAPVSALTINDNLAFLTLAPGPTPGSPLTYSWNPSIIGEFYSIDNEGRTSTAGSQASPGFDRPLGSREFRIFGTLPAGGAPHHLAVAISDPAQVAADALRAALIARGITVDGPATARHRLSQDTAIFEQSVLRPLMLGAPRPQPPAPAGTVVLASRTSVPLLEDMTVTNKVSQNLHAEIFLRLLGQRLAEDASIEEGLRVTRAFLLRAGVSPQDFFFYDGSGLSPEDRMTPRAFTQLLRYDAAQPWGAEFRSTLPVGGVDGTLSDRFLHSPLRGKIFAKTGTLNEVNSLSGYLISRRGHTLVISILCNAHSPEDQSLTHVMDRIANAVAATD